MQAAAAAAAAAALILLLTCCSVSSGYKCAENAFECVNSTVPCISKETVCDGKSDCTDSSDETQEQCQRLKICPFNEFRCGEQGNCIQESRRCDGRKDCAKGEDEDNCEVASPSRKPSLCKVNEFRCSAAHGPKCIPYRKVCNGINDCLGGDDERSCPCSRSQFLCESDKKCVSRSRVCDGIKDCHFAEDERNCHSEKCSYSTEIPCKFSKGLCHHSVHACDGNSDCKHHEDEICPIEADLCKGKHYWRCHSESHCVMNITRCDGLQHCPDASDELNCPGISQPTTTATTTAALPTKADPFKCRSDEHLCNRTSTYCVNVERACSGDVRCPFQDEVLRAKCQKLRQRLDPCRSNRGGCQQVCRSLNHSWPAKAVCSCNSGYSIDPNDKRRCVDIDECQQFGACSQNCSNSIGGFSCSCGTGYSLLPSKRCAAIIPETLLFSSTSKIMSLRHAHRELLLRNVTQPSLLAADARSGTIFYFSHSGQLCRKRLEQKQQPEVLLVNPLIQGLAYDWLRQLLYFTEMESSGQIGHLKALNLRNGRVVKLLELQCPRGIAALPQLGLLFVSQLCGSQTGIFKVNLQEAPLRADPLAATSIGYGLPLHLTVDSQQLPQRLYWSDSELRAIFSCDIGGNDTRKHWPPTTANQQRAFEGHGVPSELAVFEDSLLWVDTRSGSIRSASKFVASGFKEVVRVSGLRSVAVMHELLQPAAGRDARTCSCGHVCFATKHSPICLCDQRHSLNNSTGSCEMIILPGAASIEGFGASDYSIDGQVGSVAGIVIGVLTACVLVAALLAVVCLRRAAAAGGELDEQQLHFANESFDYFNKSPNYQRLPKVGSQATLNGSEANARH